MYKHLAFIGAGYGMCGAVAKPDGTTVTISEATCPDCVEFMRNEEQINTALHRSGRVKPTYED